MRDLVLKYSGILSLILSQNITQIIAKTSTSSQLSVSDMLLMLASVLSLLLTLLWPTEAQCDKLASVIDRTQLTIPFPGSRK